MRRVLNGKARSVRWGSDDGQVSSALIIFAVIGLTFVAIKVILPIGEATDKRTQVQTAADAAALAGAKAVAEEAVDRWRNGFRFQSQAWIWINGNSGSGAARDFAQANGARLEEYRYVRGNAGANDRAEVTVELDQATQDGVRARARAEASLRVPWSSCSWYLEPLPPPTTTTTTRPTTTVTTAPTTTTTPPPPRPRGATLTCGGLHVEFEVRGRPALYYFDDDPVRVREWLEARARLID